jgi:HK97 family phage portal protein
LRRRPNRWQKPHQFKRMMQAHVLLRGNAYAFKVPGVGGRVQALIPLHPDRVEAKQLDDWSMQYRWTRKDGRVVHVGQDDVLHLFGLTLDGVTGVTPLTYARETIGLSLSMDRHIGKVVKKGARAAGFLKSPKSLTDKAFNHLKESLEEYRQDGDKEGEVMLLEEGLEFTEAQMTPQDLQFIEGRQLSRTEIAMFFGVPPHMLGDTAKTTSWGTGIEQQTQGFVTYTLQDHLTMWEEGVTADLVDDPDVFAQFNLSALLRGDTKTRWEAHVKSLQWGVRNPNEVRALEDENPREGGDEYYDPPNTAGTAADDTGDSPMTLRNRLRVNAKARPGALPVPAQRDVCALTKPNVLDAGPKRLPACAPPRSPRATTSSPCSTSSAKTSGRAAASPRRRCPRSCARSAIARSKCRSIQLRRRYVRRHRHLNVLREHGQEITVKVMGMAASAASIIAMAGDTRRNRRRQLPDDPQLLGDGRSATATTWPKPPPGWNPSTRRCATFTLPAAGRRPKPSPSGWTTKPSCRERSRSNADSLTLLGSRPGHDRRRGPGRDRQVNDLRAMELSLVAAGLTRSEARARINKIKGTATPGADDSDEPPRQALGMNRWSARSPAFCKPSAANSRSNQGNST